MSVEAVSVSGVEIIQPYKVTIVQSYQNNSQGIKYILQNKHSSFLRHKPDGLLFNLTPEPTEGNNIKKYV